MEITPAELIKLAEVHLLSDAEAAAWLQQQSRKWSDDPVASEPDAFFRIATRVLRGRRSPRVDLAVAHYGAYRPAARTLLSSPSLAQRVAVLSNPFVGPRHSIWGGLLTAEEADAIVREAETSSVEFSALLQNPKIDRNWLAECVNRARENLEADERRLFRLVRVLRKNPMISDERKDPWMDGYADHLHNRLNFSLIALLDEVPVTQEWAYALGELLSRLRIPFVPRFKTPPLERWEDTFGTADDPDFAFRFLREQIAKLIVLDDHAASRDLRDATLLSSRPPELRLAMYERLRSYELFPKLNERSSIVPTFESSSSGGPASRMSTEQRCRDWYALDGEDFADRLLNNESMWHSDRGRRLLRSVCWRLVEDPIGDMVFPNAFNAKMAEVSLQFPDWFDESEAENDSDQPYSCGESDVDAFEEFRGKAEVFASEFQGLASDVRERLEAQEENGNRISEDLGTFREEMGELPWAIRPLSEQLVRISEQLERTHGALVVLSTIVLCGAAYLIFR